MRILVLTINYWPEPTGIGAVLTRRCEYLASVGHEVTVCTAMPYYPEWRVYSDYRRKLWCREQHQGVTILRSWIWVPEQVTTAKRICLEASFLASSLLRALGNRKPELLLVVSPPLGLALSGELLSRWAAVPYVLDVEDLQPDSAADLGMLGGPVLPLLYLLEAMAYRNASLISTVSEGMRQKIIGKGVAAQKVVVVPPSADHQLFAIGSAVESQKFRRRHGLEGKFVVAHAGNMGVKQGLHTVLDTAFCLKEQPGVAFLLAGDGVMRCDLQNRAAALNLANVWFLPSQQPAEFLQMLAATDMAVIAQQASVGDIAFPSKTVTLLSAARPVGAAVTAESEIARVIRRSESGVVTEPGKADALARTVETLFRDPEKRSAMGESGRRYALRHWDSIRILPSFESQLRKAAMISYPNQTTS